MVKRPKTSKLKTKAERAARKVLRFLYVITDSVKVQIVNRNRSSVHSLGKMIIVVELMTTNEFFFLRRILEGLAKEGHLLVFPSRIDMRGALRELLSTYLDFGHAVIVDRSYDSSIREIDLYLNATLSHDIRVPKQAKYAIHFPHVITSKTKRDLYSKAIERITDLASPGQIYDEDYQNYCQEFGINELPNLHKIGSPKSDSLFDHEINKRNFLEERGLNPDLPVVFYAPTWNKDTSAFHWLDDIFDIPEKHNVNLIIKIHPGVYTQIGVEKATGGIDWPRVFADTEGLAKKNIYNVMHKQDSADYVLASDITITDISTIWIEFYLKHKPIVFLDIPKFFERYERNALGHFEDTYGYLVKNAQSMHMTIEGMLRGELQYKKPESIEDKLVYNKGKATDAALELITSFNTYRK